MAKNRGWRPWIHQSPDQTDYFILELCLTFHKTTPKSVPNLLRCTTKCRLTGWWCLYSNDSRLSKKSVAVSAASPHHTKLLGFVKCRHNRQVSRPTDRPRTDRQAYIHAHADRSVLLRTSVCAPLSVPLLSAHASPCSAVGPLANTSRRPQAVADPGQSEN